MDDTSAHQPATWVPRQRVLDGLIQADSGLTRELAEILPDTVDELAHEQRDLAARMVEIGRDSAARLPEKVRQVDHGELLYGEDGLPE
jgi:antitoxin VapB